MVDILTGVPSIVAALFVYAVWISIFGLPRSAFRPWHSRWCCSWCRWWCGPPREMLKIVPDDLREASYALGGAEVADHRQDRHPDRAVPACSPASLLALARIMGETAPVLILVAYAPYINFDIFSGNMASLPLLMTVERSNPHGGRLGPHLGLGADPDPDHHHLPADRRGALQAHRTEDEVGQTPTWPSGWTSKDVDIYYSAFPRGEQRQA